MWRKRHIRKSKVMMMMMMMMMMGRMATVPSRFKAALICSYSLLSRLRLLLKSCSASFQWIVLIWLSSAWLSAVDSWLAGKRQRSDELLEGSGYLVKTRAKRKNGYRIQGKIRNPGIYSGPANWQSRPRCHKREQSSMCRRGIWFA